MARLLDAKGLTAAYAGWDGREVIAVDDVSLYVDEGEIVGVAGESGCGKSTLGNVLALTARPPLYVESGTMTIGGQTLDLGQVNKVPRTWRGEVVSMLPQGALNSLSATQRIRNLVVEVMKAHTKMPKSEALDRASKAYFSAHPGEELPVQEVVRRGWLISLPRFRDRLEWLLRQALPSAQTKHV